MKAGNKNNMQQSSSIIQQVLNLFQELNKVQAVSKSQIFQLIKIFRSHPTNFQQAWELAYLKILKIFHEKGNRKMPPKYENLATTFFTELMPKDGHPDGASTTFFDNFLEFLSEAVFSTLAGIRITAARMLFHLLKGCGAFTGQKAKQKLLKSVFFLVRLRVSTYKQIGIKLASIVLGWKGIIQKKVEEEFFKIMAVEENQQIRKMAMTNIWINKQNLDKVLIRLRDKCTDIRSIILRKLTGERFPLQNTELTHRFHLLYDGFGNKESSVQQDTLKYFLLFFEQPKYECFVQFVKLFQPQVLLSQPQLYSLFDLLLIEIVQEIPLSDVQEFVRKLCGDLRNFAKGNRIEVPKELIWLKALAKSENVELKALFEEQIPSGMELAKLLLELIHSKNAFCIHQCVQIFRLYKSADELGRNKMFEALKALVGGIDLWHIQTPQLVDAKSDICSALTPLQIKQKKLLLSYFDLPPITSSFDLIIEVGQAMKAIWPDHYEIQLKQLMSDWNNPEQNTLLKQKELAQANIKKAQTKNDSQIVASLRAKLKSIEGELESQIAKTKIVITTIMRLRPTASMEDYMSIVKEELSNKEDQSQGLVLLGLYCLQERDRAESFLPLYWAHINKEQPQKLHLLVSLRVLTDIFVKFDFHSLQLSALNQSKSTDQFQYSAFINKMLKFVLNTDPDIRMVAIQGLCRLVFHNRVNQERVVSCFMRLLLLWWETSSQEVSARSVHTISVFIKQFLQKGQNQVRKISEFLCIFFKMLIICQSKGQSISKYKIVYNLKMQEFVKRSVVIAMTVLKYHKQSRQVIWKYQENGAQLGPQQLLLLFLLKESKLHFCLQKAINICDFYEDAPLETLILVKKHLETFIEQTSFQSSKKLELMLKKLESDIEDRIQIKNRETFNQQLLNGLKQQLHEYQLLIQTSGTAVADELAIEEIVIQNKQTQEQSQFQDFSQQLEDPLPQELQGLEQDPFSLNQSKKPNSTLLHNRQNKVNQKANQKVQNIESDEAISNQQQVRGRKKGGKGLGETNKNRGQRNRKRQASPLQDNQSAEMQKEKIISSRTRSKVQL